MRREVVVRRGIARPAILAFVEGQEEGLVATQMGSHVDQVRIDSEMRQTAPELEQRLFRVAVYPVLAHGMLRVLPGEVVLEFGSEDRQTIEEERQIER